MEREIKGGPWFGGWLIAAGIGLVAFGICRVIGQYDYTPSVAIGSVLFLLCGIVLQWFVSGAEAAPAVVHAPVMAEAATPSPVISAPVAPASAKVAEVVPVAKAEPKPAPKPAPAKKAASKPAPVAAPVMAAATPGVAKKPKVMKAARGGKADDLKIIKGIGPKLEVLCHKLGFYHFDQVAAWTAEEIAWVDDNLEGFKGRVTRDRWVPQAKAIVELGPQEFLAQLDAGKEF